MSGKDQTTRWPKGETRLVRPGERLTLPHALPADCVEEMRSLEIEREHYVAAERSEEHTSELQSPCNLVCRLLLEKKKKNLRCRTAVCPLKLSSLCASRS